LPPAPLTVTSARVETPDRKLHSYLIRLPFPSMPGVELREMPDVVLNSMSFRAGKLGGGLPRLGSSCKTLLEATVYISNPRFAVELSRLIT